MVNIRYYSDLHNDNRLYNRSVDQPWNDAWQIPRLKTDHQTILILAGDIDNNMPRLRVQLCQLAQRFKHVIMIPGNHEYYNSSIEDVDQKLEQMNNAVHNLTVGNFKSIVIDSVLFVMCTGWTNIQSPLDRFFVESRNNDYKRIKTRSDLSSSGSRHINVSDTNFLHRSHCRFIESEIDNHRFRKSVVVTHHCPWYRYAGRNGIRLDSYTPTYIDLSGKLEQAVSRYDYAISGHIHNNSLDRVIHDRTMSLTNNVGYGTECVSSVTHRVLKI